MLPLSRQLSIKLLQRCPSCREGLPTNGINLISETDDAILAHISCPHCQHNYLTYVINNSHGLIGNAMLTDLTYNETLQSLRRESISENDVLSIYAKLSQNDFLTQIHLELNQSNRKNNHV